MNQQVNVKSTFSKLSDADALTQAGAVMKGIFVDKAISAQPPVDQATFQAAIDDLNAAMIAVTQSGGGTTMITVKNAKRKVLDNDLRKLAHFVQLNCNEDQQIVAKTGFQSRLAPVRSNAQLDKASIVSIDTLHTRQLSVTAGKVLRAKLYEVGVAVVGANTTVGPFQSAGFFTKSRAMAVTGLTPGTTYAVQVRALGGTTGSGDWSDPVAHMCM